MDKVIYRITLEATKTGVQKKLQGFWTGEGQARQIVISLVAGSAPVNIPAENVVAVMYVSKPGVNGPCINPCVIDGNTIVYDVLAADVDTAGMVGMQMKLVAGGADGAEAVLLSPEFALEVSQSRTGDAAAEQTATFTALEDALVKAQAAYAGSIQSITVTPDYMFVATYYDGTVYESDCLKVPVELAVSSAKKAEETTQYAAVSKSYAVGDTGTRGGEDTDNAKYYNQSAQNARVATMQYMQATQSFRDEVMQHSMYTVFSLDFETGNLMYESQVYEFSIDYETGNLIWITALSEMEEE